MQNKLKLTSGHPTPKNIAENVRIWENSFDKWYQRVYTICRVRNNPQKILQELVEMAKNRTSTVVEVDPDQAIAAGMNGETPTATRKKRTNSPVILFITYRNGGTQQSKPFDSKKVALAVADVYVNQPALNPEQEIVTVEVYRQVLKLTRKE